MKNYPKVILHSLWILLVLSSVLMVVGCQKDTKEETTVSTVAETTEVETTETETEKETEPETEAETEAPEWEALVEIPEEDFSSYENEQPNTLAHFGIPLYYVFIPPFEKNFETLCALNPDVCGWISIPNSSVRGPIVQSHDNVEYLRIGADGQNHNAGSMFVDYRVENPFHGAQTMIHAHNQRNHSLFHDLYHYMEAEYADEHPLIFIYDTDNNRMDYRVFAAFKAPETSYVYILNEDASTMGEYLERVLQDSVLDFGVEVTAEDQILTLSTCTNEYDENRYVVFAKLVSD